MNTQIVTICYSVKNGVVTDIKNSYIEMKEVKARKEKEKCIKSNVSYAAKNF